MDFIERIFALYADGGMANPPAFVSSGWHCFSTKPDHQENDVGADNDGSQVGDEQQLQKVNLVQKLSFDGHLVPRSSVK